MTRDLFPSFEEVADEETQHAMNVLSAPHRDRQYTRQNRVGKNNEQNGRRSSGRGRGRGRGQKRGRGRGRGRRSNRDSGWGSARSTPNNGQRRQQQQQYSAMPSVSSVSRRHHSQPTSNRNEPPQQGREYHPEIYFTGEVAQMKGKWGFIKPDHPVGHDAFKRRKEGLIFFHMNDVDCNPQDITEQTKVMFYLYVDARGLGAHRITAPELARTQGLRILLSIEKSYVGNLIGKKGSTILRLSKENGAKIQLQRREECDDFAQYRTCIITGKPENMIKACYAVADCIATAAQSLNAKIKFLMKPRCLGRLIGKKGANIKAIQNKFPSVKADSDRSSEPPVFYDNEPYRGFQCFGPNNDMKLFIEQIGYEILAFDGYERPAVQMEQSPKHDAALHDNNDNAPGTTYQDSITIF